jgi:3-methyl-2-oxobutanoate hydroxymethyltransferase
MTIITEMPPPSAPLKKDLAFLQAKKGIQPLTMLTCYDYPTACLEDQAGIDIIFVGDSVGTNVLGYTSEREVTMADMVHHLKAVRRGVTHAFVLVDLPYQSYATSHLALENATTFLAHGADAVKLEGGREQEAIVRGLTEHNITVCGHIGFTPQTLRQVGKKARVQGRTVEQAQALVQSAVALEQAGAQLLVLELVPEPLAKLITERLRIPTIGIGAGRFCDGQVLIVNDVLGITPFQLRFAKQYQHYHDQTLQAIEQFQHEVEQRDFPSEANVFGMEERMFADVAAWARNL